MKQEFIPRKFTPESESLIAVLDRIIREYQSQGFSLTLRQLYYQTIALDLLPESWRSKDVNQTKNTFHNYKRLGDLVSNARNAGRLDWGAIEDRGREASSNAHWRDPGEIVEAAANGFRIDHWQNQENYVEVMVEKDALSGILGPVCRRLDVTFTANKGYSSSSAMYEAGQRFAWHSNASELHLFYLGDHDPSGLDMTNDVLSRLELYSEMDITMHRLALNMDQVLTWSPPPNPAKETDSRYAKYRSRYGDESWELDAVKPEDLAKLVQDAVTELIDQHTMQETLAREEEMRMELRKFADKYKRKRRK